MKSWKKLVVLAVIVAIVGYFGCKFYNIYTAGPENIRKAKAISVDASALLEDYNKSETDANRKYIGKILAVTGEVKEISKNQEGQTVVTLKTSDPMNTVNCTMEGEATGFNNGKTITLKGMCTGYMMDVYLTRCYIAE